MSKIIHKININVDTGVCKVDPPIDIYQGDRGSHVLLMQLFDNNGNFVEINPGVINSIAFYCNGRLIESSGVKVENAYRGRLSYVVSESVVDKFGRYTVYLTRKINDKVVSSFSFVVNVILSHNYNPKTDEILLTQKEYDELMKIVKDNPLVMDHLKDLVVHVTQEDHDVINYYKLIKSDIEEMLQTYDISTEIIDGKEVTKKISEWIQQLLDNDDILNTNISNVRTSVNILDSKLSQDEEMISYHSGRLDTQYRMIEDNKLSINKLSNELSSKQDLLVAGEGIEIEDNVISTTGDYATREELLEESESRQESDNNLQSQIDAITVSSDVVDVVGTYQELINYDTSGLGDNSIIKVLQDSTHNNSMSYYKWIKSSSQWDYVGSEGPFYTKSESDNKFQEKLVSGENIKTINNESILGSGNIDIEAGVGGGINLTPLEVPDDYMNLMEFINDAEIPETYTISNDNYVNIDVVKEDTIDTVCVSKGSIISVYPGSSATILAGEGQYTYFNYGEYLSGGVSTNSEEVETLIDEKLGSNVVMTNTDQTISGQKKFISDNGTIFENSGGVFIRNSYSVPAFKIIPDNNGNFDIYYQNTQLCRIDSNNTTLYRGLIPYLTEQVDLGSNNYKFNNIYVKKLYDNNVPKEVSNLITNNNDVLPKSGGAFSLGNLTYRWDSLYLDTNINFNPLHATMIDHLKTLSVNLINLWQQQGSTTSNFLQYDGVDGCVGKLLGGLNVNNMPIHNIPDTPDNGTSPINKNYADTNLQGKLTFDSTPTASSTNPVTSDGVFNSIQNVIEVAEGKTATYTLSYSTTGNADFNSQNNSITVSSFVDTAGNTITDEDVKVGDIILIIETEVPDRWVQSIDTTSHTITFYKLETSKIDLNNYVDLTSNQTITGNKTIASGSNLSFAGTDTGVIENSGSYFRIKLNGINKLNLNTNKLYSVVDICPNSPSSQDLGDNSYAWRNIKFTGFLGDTNAQYGLKLPNTTGYTANKTIATEEYVDTAIGDIDTALTGLISGGGVV